MKPLELLGLATDRHRAGFLAEARGLYREFLAEEPLHAVGSLRAGLLELQDGEPAAALRLLDQAATSKPDEARHHVARGRALHALQRGDEAVAAYRRALQLDPDDADTHFALGVALQVLRLYAPAISAYEATVRCRPEDADALNNLGICLGELGQAGAAVASLRAAVDLRPHAVLHAINLGIALNRQRNFAAAEQVLRAAADRDPNNAEAAFNLGIALHGQGRAQEAADRYRHAALQRPQYADALNNLGNVYRELGAFALAASAYAAAIGAQPESVVALNNTGCLLRTLGEIDAAETMLRRGLAVDPAIHCFRRSLELNPGSAPTHSNLAYSLGFQSSTGAPILEECRRWNDRFAAALTAGSSPHSNERSSGRRLRIGYVSPDFREHCQSMFTIPLLEHHDHDAFEVHCYASVARPDDCTRRLSGLADVWRDAASLDDAALAELIRTDRIDILVDLNMHMAAGRPLLFARRPAPLQVAWLAYPGTTGIAAMDYRLSDPRLDPVGVDGPYSERTRHLPDSFWCYQPFNDRIEVNALPALERGHLTFGCLNSPCKLTDSTLRLWGALLGALPDARLVLMAPPGRHRDELARRLAAHGVDAARLTFLPFQQRDQYLRAYHDIDVAIDTLPYNGHTTSLDSFWMGVPVISRVGDTCVGRGGLSQLHQLDLLELAAATDAEFVGAAVALAGDLPRLALMRRGLRGRMQRSPLMDAPKFARGLEAVYRSIWREYCAG
jgi:predicted O-linked N-acetylglucosamine transferase (SPINDLY family)